MLKINVFILNVVISLLKCKWNLIVLNVCWFFLLEILWKVERYYFYRSYNLYFVNFFKCIMIFFEYIRLVILVINIK